MFPRHACHFDGSPLLGSGLDVDEQVLEEIKIVDGGEGFVGGFGGSQVRFGVWGRNYGKVAAEGGLDLFVEVVAFLGS